MAFDSGTVLVTGATGLIGRRLVPALSNSGHKLILLSRRPHVAAQLAGAHRVVSTMAELSPAQHIDAIVHLAGEPVAAKLWSERRKRELLESRADLPRQIGLWIAAAEHKPTVWLNASAIGYYGTPEDPEQEFSESDPSGPGFAAELCSHIEGSAQSGIAGGSDSKLRLVQLRIGLVLAGEGEGGYLGKLLTPVKLMVGAVLGSGRQWQSWIHIDDAVKAIEHCLSEESLVGPVNLTAPQPVRAKSLMDELGAVLKRPVFFHVPEFLLRLVAKDMADDLLLASQRVLPKRLLDSGFLFSYPELPAALTQLLAKKTSADEESMD